MKVSSPASRAAAQIPDLWFDPPSRSYPAPDQQLSVHVCGDIVSQTSIKVWLNGTQLTPTFSGSDPSLCAVQ